MNTDLHKQKVEILHRLIKEGSLTVDESLILLKEDVDNQEVKQAIQRPGGGWVIPFGGSISSTHSDGSTWNSSVSYAKVDETPTI